MPQISGLVVLTATGFLLSFMFVNKLVCYLTVGAAVAIVGLAAYRVYAARKNTSS